MAVTQAKEWKKSTHVELKLPSGNVCLAKRPGMKHFLEAGYVPNSLLEIVKDAVAGVDNSASVAKAIKDSESVIDMMTFMDLVVHKVVVQPATLLPPAEEGVKRKEDVLYIDEVDEQDKSFIFNWAVGGTGSYERFLEEQKAMLESLAEVKETKPATKRTTRRKK